jgi:hypothetical protein
MIYYDIKVSQYINPKEWNIYDILETVSLSKIREVYDKYYILMISIYQMIKKEFKIERNPTLINFKWVY